MPIVRFFAAAAEVIGTTELHIEADSLGSLQSHVTKTYGQSAAKVIARCSFLVNGVRQDSAEFTLDPADLVDVLPPFAGG